MAKVWLRLLGVRAVVCLLLSLWAGSARAEEREAFIFEETAEAPGISAYPPRDRSRPAGVTVMLHGMCGEPQRTCRHLANVATENEWLLCPRARLRCDGGGSTWPSAGFERDIEAGIQRVKASFPGELDDEAGRTLIGFSLGAFRALALAQDAQGQYPRVILIGAKIQPDAARLRRAGVQRLLLAAGEWDMMRGHMAERTRALLRQGFPVAFQSYGPVGHAFPSDFAERLQRGLHWTRGDDDALAK